MPESAQHRGQVYFRIDRTFYEVSRLPGGWKFLRRPTGAEKKQGVETVEHQVHRQPDGKLACTCEASTYRPMEQCKHRKFCLALVSLGMIPQPKDW